MELLTLREVRDRYYATSNYPLVCRTVGCYTRLGLYHRDMFPERALAITKHARVDSLEAGVVCNNCDVLYDLRVHEHGECDGFPSSARISLFCLPFSLRRSAKNSHS